MAGYWDCISTDELAFLAACGDPDAKAALDARNAEAKAAYEATH